MTDRTQIPSSFDIDPKTLKNGPGLAQLKLVSTRPHKNNTDIKGRLNFAKKIADVSNNLTEVVPCAFFDGDETFPSHALVIYRMDPGTDFYGGKNYVLMFGFERPGGAYTSDYRNPSFFPTSPPHCMFVTNMDHVNVYPTSRGHQVICVDILKGEAWNPNISINNVMEVLTVLGNQPGMDSPWNVDASNNHKPVTAAELAINKFIDGFSYQRFVDHSDFHKLVFALRSQDDIRWLIENSTISGDEISTKPSEGENTVGSVDKSLEHFTGFIDEQRDPIFRQFADAIFDSKNDDGKPELLDPLYSKKIKCLRQIDAEKLAFAKGVLNPTNVEHFNSDFTLIKALAENPEMIDKSGTMVDKTKLKQVITEYRTLMKSLDSAKAGYSRYIDDLYRSRTVPELEKLAPVFKSLNCACCGKMIAHCRDRKVSLYYNVIHQRALEAQAKAMELGIDKPIQVKDISKATNVDEMQLRKDVLDLETVIANYKPPEKSRGRGRMGRLRRKK